MLPRFHVRKREFAIIAGDDPCSILHPDFDTLDADLSLTLVRVPVIVVEDFPDNYSTTCEHARAPRDLFLSRNRDVHCSECILAGRIRSIQSIALHGVCAKNKLIYQNSSASRKERVAGPGGQ